MIKYLNVVEHRPFINCGQGRISFKDAIRKGWKIEKENVSRVSIGWSEYGYHPKFFGSRAGLIHLDSESQDVKVFKLTSNWHDDDCLIAFSDYHSQIYDFRSRIEIIKGFEVLEHSKFWKPILNYWREGFYIIGKEFGHPVRERILRKLSEMVLQKF